MATLPEYALLFGKRRVRVLGYVGNNRWFVLDGGSKVFVGTDALTFLP